MMTTATTTKKRKKAARKGRRKKTKQPESDSDADTGARIDIDRPVVIAYGAGLDSFTMLTEGIERGERIDSVAFCDVSDGSPTTDPTFPGEWLGTYRHIREVVIPLCDANGIAFEWIDTVRYPVRATRANPAGNRALFEYFERKLMIPVASENFRNCTLMAKVERFESWLDDTYPDQAVEVWVGFDAAEGSRVEKDPNAGSPREHKPGQAIRINRYPLVEWQLCRCRCEARVHELGYPVPRKSACVFCPMAKRRDWRKLQRQLPETFARIEQLEADKPPTKANGIKLGIMHLGRKRKDGSRPPSKMLAEWVAMEDQQAGRGACEFCGAPEKATKLPGCDWLAADEMLDTTTGGACAA